VPRGPRRWRLRDAPRRRPPREPHARERPSRPHDRKRRRLRRESSELLDLPRGPRRWRLRDAPRRRPPREPHARERPSRPHDRERRRLRRESCGDDSRRRRGECERERERRRRDDEAVGARLEALSTSERPRRSSLQAAPQTALVPILMNPSTRVPVRPHCEHVSSGEGLRLRGPRPRVDAGTRSGSGALRASRAQLVPIVPFV
jgi:hypothetical protein